MTCTLQKLDAEARKSYPHGRRLLGVVVCPHCPAAMPMRLCDRAYRELKAQTTLILPYRRPLATPCRIRRRTREYRPLVPKRVSWETTSEVRNLWETLSVSRCPESPSSASSLEPLSSAPDAILQHFRASLMYPDMGGHLYTGSPGQPPSKTIHQSV